MRASRKVFAVLGLAVATVCVGSASADDRRHKEEVVRARLIGINEVPSISTVKVSSPGVPACTRRSVPPLAKTSNRATPSSGVLMFW